MRRLVNAAKVIVEVFMAKKKFYAVVDGSAPGIYESWESCSKAMQEYGGHCKGFSDRRDAENFLKGISEDEDYGGLTAFVDGSFEVSVGRYGFGCVILQSGNEPIEYYGSGNNEESAALRNVTGEMLGAMFAVKWAMARGYKDILICYDYEGVEKWATGVWKAKTELTSKYAVAMKEWGRKISISFRKIAAHTGNRYNERADQLAKKAIEEEVPIPDFRL